MRERERQRRAHVTRTLITVDQIEMVDELNTFQQTFPREDRGRHWDGLILILPIIMMSL